MRHLFAAVSELAEPLPSESAHPKTPLIASIESPESLMNIGAIAGWRGRGVELVGLTVSLRIVASYPSPSCPKLPLSLRQKTVGTRNDDASLDLWPDTLSPRSLRIFPYPAFAFSDGASLRKIQHRYSSTHIRLGGDRHGKSTLPLNVGLRLTCSVFSRYASIIRISRYCRRRPKREGD